MHHWHSLITHISSCSSFLLFFIFFISQWFSSLSHQLFIANHLIIISPFNHSIWCFFYNFYYTDISHLHSDNKPTTTCILTYHIRLILHSSLTLLKCHHIFFHIGPADTVRDDIRKTLILIVLHPPVRHRSPPLLYPRSSSHYNWAKAAWARRRQQLN